MPAHHVSIEEAPGPITAKPPSLTAAGSRPRWTAYALAVAVTVATLVVRMGLEPWIGDRPVLILFILPITLSAYVGGLGPGLAATAVAALGTDYFLTPPIHSFAFGRPVDLGQWLILIACGVFISGLTESLHRSRRVLRAHEGWLDATIKENSDLRAALDEHAIVAITDARGKITFANDKFCAISKYARGELLGQDHRIINSGYHPKEFIRDLWTTIMHGRVWHGELKNKAKDGTFYWVDTTIVPFLDEQGKPRQYVAIRTDITERKQEETAAKELAAIVKFSDDAIIGKNLQSLVTSWNDGAEKIFGYAAAEMLGQPILRIIPADRQQEEEVIMGRIKQGESVEHFETLRQAKDGRLIEISVTVSPIKDSAGRVVGASKIARDISERKMAEKKIRQLNAELEQRVVERTAQLESANKELEAFSYSVSHDLRAPLRAVDGFSQAVLEDYGPQLPEEGQRYLHTIRDGAQRMGVLIDDLLMFSRLSRLPLNQQTVNTNVLVKGVLAELRAAQPERAVEIQLGELPPCQGDAALLKQAWVNLLSNAYKYSRKRQPAIVSIGCEAQNGENVYYVRDNGVGFDMRYAHKLFGVFQRLHRADEYEGTGVGLAIVQRVVHRHGGRVWAESVPDQGATFYFTLNGGTKP